MFLMLLLLLLIDSPLQIDDDIEIVESSAGSTPSKSPSSGSGGGSRMVFNQRGNVVQQQQQHQHQQQQQQQRSPAAVRQMNHRSPNVRPSKGLSPTDSRKSLDESIAGSVLSEAMSESIAGESTSAGRRTGLSVGVPAAAEANAFTSPKHQNVFSFEDLAQVDAAVDEMVAKSPSSDTTATTRSPGHAPEVVKAAARNSRGGGNVFTIADLGAVDDAVNQQLAASQESLDELKLDQAKDAAAAEAAKQRRVRAEIARDLAEERAEEEARAREEEEVRAALKAKQSRKFMHRAVTEWSVENVGVWVGEVLHLPCHDEFVAAAVDGRLLLELSEDELLTDLKVSNRLHRKKLAVHIMHLQEKTRGARRSSEQRHAQQDGSAIPEEMGRRQAWGPGSAGEYLRSGPGSGTSATGMPYAPGLGLLDPNSPALHAMNAAAAAAAAALHPPQGGDFSKEGLATLLDASQQLYSAHLGAIKNQVRCAAAYSAAYNAACNAALAL